MSRWNGRRGSPALPSPIGAPLPRLEDDRLLRGRSRYVSDLAARQGALHVLFLRSPHAHARLLELDVSRARALPGTLAIIAASDVAHLEPVPADWVPDGMRAERLHPLLVADVARYVGEPVAAVVADTPWAARDALEAIDVRWETLPCTLEQEAALAPDAPRVHADTDNLAYSKRRVSGNPERALAGATVVLERRFVNSRLAPSPMEGRAVLSTPDPIDGTLVHHTSTQLPHVHARALARCLSMPLNRLRLVSPDVGGGFGAKLGFYAEDVVVAHAALSLGRPCRWIQTRAENLAGNTHGRDHVQHVRLGADAHGRVTGLDVHLVADLGAYALGMGPGVPAINAGLSVTGPYDITDVGCRVDLAYTHRMPTGPYRGAGHPEASYLIERMMDELAAELELDPAEVRRRNFVPPARMPYKLPTGFVLDSGDYAANLDTALERSGYAELRARARRESNAHRRLGVGLCTYSETSGAAPSIGMGAVGFRRAGHESARVVVHSDARVTVFSGGHSHGQGHATTLAQIAAGALGVAVEHVEVVQGDTAAIPFGTGTYNSRTMAVGGTAVWRAAEAIAAKLRRIAADRLRCLPAQVRLENGVFRVAGGTGAKAGARSFKRIEERIKDRVFGHLTGLSLAPVRRPSTVSLGDIVAEAHLGHDMPLGLPPGLDETVFFDPKEMPASYATHVSLVEIDLATGHVGLLRHVVVDDCGTVINPLLAAGQVHGGAAQGIGQALMEFLVHASDGRGTASSFEHYAVPRASDLPEIECSHTVTPTTLNPLGAKGLGEGATIGAPPAIANAILDALRPLGVTELDMPFTPERVLGAVVDAAGKALPLANSRSKLNLALSEDGSAIRI